MSRFLSLILAVILALFTTTACSSEPDAILPTEEYTGILTKVKLGMPKAKVLSLQDVASQLYYEDDTTIWTVNPDTDIMQLRQIIPTDNQHYYADDSIITYFFKTVSGDSEIYLEAYSQETKCLLDKTLATQFFNEKIAALEAQHFNDETKKAAKSVLGTEDIDYNVVHSAIISAPSYELEFNMTLSYEDVLGVEDYYATKFEIIITEKDKIEPQPEN